jgi:hypothetical protein
MKLGLPLTVGLLLVSSVARAAPPPDRAGVDLGVRVGYAVPFGDIDADRGSLAGWVSGAVPVLIEAGYRFHQHFTLGPYFQYAFARVKENSNTRGSSGSGCSGWIVRAGAQALYHLHVAPTLAPWVGVGIGYEWTDYTGTIGDIGFSASASGVEFLNVQIGGDFAIGPGTKLGPFVSFSLARYDSVSGVLGGLSGSSDVSNPAVHEWLQFGARFLFGL